MTQPLLPTMRASLFDDDRFRVPCPRCTAGPGELCRSKKGGLTKIAHQGRNALGRIMQYSETPFDETRRRDQVAREFAALDFPRGLVNAGYHGIAVQVTDVATHVMSRRECGIHDGWEIPASFGVIAESALACDADHIIDPDTGELDEVLAQLVVEIIAKNQDF